MTWRVSVVVVVVVVVVLSPSFIVGDDEPADDGSGRNRTARVITNSSIHKEGK